VCVCVRVETNRLFFSFYFRFKHIKKKNTRSFDTVRQRIPRFVPIDFSWKRYLQ